MSIFRLVARGYQDVDTTDTFTWLTFDLNKLQWGCDIWYYTTTTTRHSSFGISYLLSQSPITLQYDSDYRRWRDVRTHIMIKFNINIAIANMIEYFLPEPDPEQAKPQVYVFEYDITAYYMNAVQRKTFRKDARNASNVRRMHKGTRTGKDLISTIMHIREPVIIRGDLTAKTLKNITKLVPTAEYVCKYEEHQRNHWYPTTNLNFQLYRIPEYDRCHKHGCNPQRKAHYEFALGIVSQSKK
jgi:hypothetical protein